MSNYEKKQFLPHVEAFIPLPEKNVVRTKETAQRINWPFTTMSHGDSFLLPQGCDVQKAYKALSALKRRKDISEQTSLITQASGDTTRVWLITNA
jgi:hypothetical protein